jgi:hypothetical protein
MVLTYLPLSIPYHRVRRVLGTTEEGTPFHHLDRLRRWGLTVVLDEGTIAALASHLQVGLPVVVDVVPGELPYWQARTDIVDLEKVTAHAVIVVGLDDQTLYVNDPDFEVAPQEVSLGDFDLAWQARDYRYAVISLA